MLRKRGDVNVCERGRETILIAGDDDAVRFILKRILVSAGYCVLEARNGQEAVDLVSMNMGQVDGGILDISMPLMDGIEARDRISEISPSMPVMFISAVMERFINRTPLIEGVNFVRKPYTRQELLSVLRTNLDSADRLTYKQPFRADTVSSVQISERCPVS